MKRLTFALFSIAISLSLISWGFKGHKAIALIAYNHLNFNVIPVVEYTLHGKSMSDVASWADEVRNEPEYKATAPWHFVNVPLGLSFSDFQKAVTTDTNPNLYSAILSCENQLKDKDLDPQKKEEALKFLIHLVGDAHQPMHVSRKEDKGGNTIQVRYDDKGTNLHALWDSKLIEQEGIPDDQIAARYDDVSQEDVQKWQKDDPIVWLWESYQISTKLYSEVTPGQNIDDLYYTNHIKIIHQRIDQAGVRLAGVLNTIFKNDAKVKIKLLPPPHVPSSTSFQYPEAELKDIPNLLGNPVSTKGKVFGIKQFSGMTLVNLGAPYPDQLLTVVLKGEAKDHFTSDFLNGKTLIVHGIVSKYKGKPQIVVTESKNLSVSE